MSVFTVIPDFVLDEVLGYQDVNEIKENCAYLKDAPTFAGNVVINGTLDVGTSPTTLNKAAVGDGHLRFKVATVERASAGVQIFTASSANYFGIKSQAGIELGVGGDSILISMETAGNIVFNQGANGATTFHSTSITFNKAAVGTHHFFKVATVERAALGVQIFTGSGTNYFGIMSQSGIELGTGGDNIRITIANDGNITFGAVGATTFNSTSITFNKAAVGAHHFFKVATVEQGAVGVQIFTGSATNYFGFKAAAGIEFGTSGDNLRVTIGSTGGVILGAATGGDKGAGTLNAAADIYKNNSAYNNPDYAFDYYFDGKVQEKDTHYGYTGLLSFERLRNFISDRRHLPRISRDPSGLFERGDMILLSIEEIYLYVLELESRLSNLDGLKV